MDRSLSGLTNKQGYLYGRAARYSKECLPYKFHPFALDVNSDLALKLEIQFSVGCKLTLS